MSDAYADQMRLLLKRMLASCDFSPPELFVEEVRDILHYEVRALLEKMDK